MFGELILNDVQEKWLGTLTSVPNKGKKVPRHAPVCLIGCAAYGRKRALDVSARMRELARLLIRLQRTNHGPVRLEDFLDRNGFDKVIEALEVEGRSYVHDSGRRLCKSPAFILKVGNSLLKCAQLKRGSALCSGDDVSMKPADDFITL